MKSDNSLAGKVNDLSEELIEPEIMMDPIIISRNSYDVGEERIMMR